MKIAVYNTIDDARRAIRRAERWLVKAQIEYLDMDKPPFHIGFNATLADQQFGQAALTDAR